MSDAIDDIILREGGYVNNNKDKGGPTKFGITQATLRSYLQRPATIQDVQALTKETAREIYERQYLTGPRIRTLPEPPQAFVVDCRVNHGPKNAVKILQRVLNAAGFGPVDVDGVIGPSCRAACEKAAQEMGNYLINALVDERIAFYNAIVAHDPTQAEFIRGWLRRAESFRIAV